MAAFDLVKIHASDSVILPAMSDVPLHANVNSSAPERSGLTFTQAFSKLIHAFMS